MLAALLIPAAVAAEPAEAFIYWANEGGGNPPSESGSIGRSDLSAGGTTQSFIAETVGPCGVAVDDEYIYWANMDTGTIARANLDGSNPDPSFITGADGPCGVAVDDEFVYWANYGESNFDPPTGTTIGRANLDGTAADQSFVGGADAPGAVAVDDEFVYWANFNGNTIGRANLDGSSPNHSFISSSHVNKPFGVAVNDTNVFWTNWSIAPTGTIGVADIDGSDPNQSFITGANFPCGVAVDDSFVYWGNDQLVGIGRATLAGTGVDQSFVEGTNYPCGVAVNADFPLPETSPDSLAFGNQLVGTTSPSQDVIVTNSSATSVDLEINTVETTDIEEFSASLNCQFVTLAPGESCTTTVDFSPTSVGGKSAFLSLGSDGGPILVPLSGTGTDPDQTVSPTSIAFGSQLVGTTTPPQTVTLTNGSGASASDQIGDVTTEGTDATQFSIVTDDCTNVTLPPAGECEITVDFGPTSTGVKQASLSIPSETDPAQSATVALSGTGTAPDEVVSPAAIQFGSQAVDAQSATRTVAVENSADATAALAIGSISLAGTGADQFDVAFDGCSNTSVSPGDGCQLGLRFTPTAAGAAAASVRIPSNGSASPVNVGLGGTGTRTPPSNQFTLGKAKKNKRKGTATLPVQVPDAGTLGLAGGKVRPVTDETLDAGEVVLTVKSAGGAKKKLKRKGKAKVGFDVTFTPVGGEPSTQTATLKLVKKRGRR